MKTCSNCADRHCGNRGAKAPGCLAWMSRFRAWEIAAGVVTVAIMLVLMVILALSAWGDEWALREKEQGRAVPEYTIRTYGTATIAWADKQSDALYVQDTSSGICVIGGLLAEWDGHPVPTAHIMVTRWADLDRYRVMVIADELVKEATRGHD